MSSGDAARRQQILAAAERLLHHYGPHKTTMAEIAREATIGVGSVYLEFASKEAIIEELSELRHRAVLEAMRDAAARSTLRFEARLRALLDARVQAFLKLAGEGAHARDLVHCGNPSVRAARARFLGHEHTLVATLLREGERAGEFEVKKVELTATVVLRAYASFAPPYVFSEPADDVHRALKCMHDLVLKGLLTRTVERRGNGRG